MSIPPTGIGEVQLVSFSLRRSTLFVALCLVACWAVAAAAEPQRRIPLQIGEQGGSCRVDDAGSAPAPRAPALTAEQLQAIRLRMQAAVVADRSSGTIPLNGRGYNYRAANDPTRELLLIQRELDASR
jgi:hypothetical protein